MPTPSDTRHTLLALCGSSPAIITETIWALAEESAHNPQEADLPDRIIILTTSHGHKEITAQLLQPGTDHSPPIWSQLKQALTSKGFPTENKLRFGNTSEHIHCFNSENLETGISTPLEDIRNQSDQNAAADYMLEILASLTDQPGEQLTVSIAGGRKTMSALLYGCMTLLGRRNDRLTHVLVDPPFDSPHLSPRFFFPAQSDTDFQLNGHSYLPDQANIQLADIPFVPLRYAFPDQLGPRPISFQRLSALYTGAALQRTNLPEITLNSNHADLTLEIGTHSISIPPSLAGILHFLISRALDEEAPIHDYQNAIDPLNHHLQKLKSSAPPANLSHWLHKINSLPLDEEAFRKRISALRKKLQESSPIGPELAKRLPEKGRVSFDYPPNKLIL